MHIGKFIKAEICVGMAKLHLEEATRELDKLRAKKKEAAKREKDLEKLNQR